MCNILVCCLSVPQDVAKEPYRLRILNGCNAKSLIIYFRCAEQLYSSPSTLGPRQLLQRQELTWSASTLQRCISTSALRVCQCTTYNSRLKIQSRLQSFPLYF